VAFDSHLAQRIRVILGERPGVVERRMFGGLAFLRGRTMFIGVIDALLMARVGAAQYADALRYPNVREMNFTGRPLTGFVFVEPAGTADADELRRWVEACFAYAGSLPPPRVNEGNVATLANLGPKSRTMLAAAGIGTVAQLRELGAVRAYAAVKRESPGASLNLLWAMEGALSERDWKSVAKEDRLRLLLELEDVQAMTTAFS
jgi:hypothetical protein